MNTLFWVIDLIIPALLVCAGIFYRKYAPREINSLHGYRSQRSLRSQASWRYAQHYAAKVWFGLGIGLIGIISFNRSVLSINTALLSVIHIILGIVVGLGAVFIVEERLKKTFEDTTK